MAVKFDLYSNQGEGNDSTGLFTDGAAPTNVGSINLSSTGYQSPQRARIPGNLSLQRVNVDREQ